MAEIEGIPPRLLSAVRAEVKKSTEEQLNDLWMVVHSLRDGMGGGGGGPDLSPRLEELQAEIESLRLKRPEAAPSGEAVTGDVTRLEESLGMFENATEDRFSSLEAKAEQLVGLQSQVERFEQELGQQLARQEKEFAEKLAKQEKELRDRLKELEASQLEVDRLKQRLEDTESQVARVGKQGPAEKTDLSAIEKRLAALETAGPTVVAAPASPAAIVMPSGEGLSDAELAALPTNLGYEIEDLLEVVITNDATDLHIKPNSKPMVRRNGELIPIGKMPLSEIDCRALVLKALPGDKRSRLHKRQEVEFSLSVSGSGFRMSAFWGCTGLGATFRLIPTAVPTPPELNIPELLERLALQERGLFIITGSAASGKSTTLASLIDYVNTHRKLHIIALENPIEFLIADKRSFVCQREIGCDTENLSEAIKHAARQDPDIIAVGAMEHRDEILAALQAAAAHYLVIAVYQSEDPASAISEMVGLFAPDDQFRVRELLCSTLLAVSGQKLTGNGDDARPEFEILVANSKVRSLIYEGRFEGLKDLSKAGSSGSSPSAEPARPSREPESHPSMELPAVQARPAPSIGQRPPAPKATPPAPTPPAPTPPAPAPAPAPAVAAPPSASTPTPSTAPTEPPSTLPPADGEDEALLGWL